MNNHKYGVFTPRSTSAKFSADYQLAKYFADYQPLGSMPRRLSSLRPSVFIQLPKLIPASAAAASNCAFSSGVILIWKVGDFPAPFGCLSRVIIDMYVPICILSPSIGQYISMLYLQKETPPNSIASTERGLTTNDRLSIEVAMNQNTTPLTGRNSHTLSPYQPTASQRTYLSPARNLRASLSPAQSLCRQNLHAEIISTQHYPEIIGDVQSVGVFLDSRNLSILDIAPCPLNLFRVFCSFFIFSKNPSSRKSMCLLLGLRKGPSSGSTSSADKEMGRFFMIQPFGASLDFLIFWCLSLRASCSSVGYLRWRRLASVWMAEAMYFPVLSPSSLVSTIKSITSCGIRAAMVCDFAFTAFVAITESPLVRCLTVWHKKLGCKCLTCSTQECGLVLNTYCSHAQTTKPLCVPSTTRASNHNANEGYTMAEIQSTQTHPKFLRRLGHIAPIIEAIPAYTRSNATTRTISHISLCSIDNVPPVHVFCQYLVSTLNHSICPDGKRHHAHQQNEFTTLKVRLTTRLPSANYSGYSACVAPQWAIGCRSLNTRAEHSRLNTRFFCVRKPCYSLIMVGRSGGASALAGFSCASLLTLLRLTTPFRSGQVRFKNLTREATAMVTTPTPSHPAFVWRFYSCQQQKPTLHTVAAHSEQEARTLLPSGRLVFAARIRQEVRHA